MVTGPEALVVLGLAVLAGTVAGVLTAVVVGWLRGRWPR